MSDSRSLATTKTKHRRLWPLLFLPLLGTLAGFYFESTRTRVPFAPGKLAGMGPVVLGLLVGCGAMVTVTSVVLAYRVSRRRFTIGTILVTIAIIATLLAWARSLLD